MILALDVYEGVFMKFTEAMLDAYSQPLSATEEQHCRNAIRLVSDSLKKLGFTDDGKEIRAIYPDTYSYSLQLRNINKNREIKLLVQGSYANNTNVRTQSDVDIAVIQEEVFNTQYRTYGNPPQSDANYHFDRITYPPKSFKDEVQVCLEADFGTDVERKNKSIKIHGNTYRKDTDTVPCRRYRDYRNDYLNNVNNYVGGIIIFPDKGSFIINYPEQHIKNGREKNINTHQYYKKYVRIMKKMRYLMQEEEKGVFQKAAQGVSSFMLESLLWNIEDQWYLDNCGRYRKVYVFKLMIEFLLVNQNNFKSYKEANGIKPLCRDDTEFQKLNFFVKALHEFYSYE